MKTTHNQISTQITRLTLFKNSYLLIEYEQENELLTQIWKGYAGSDGFRKGILESLRIFQEQKVSLLLSDTRQQDVVNPKDTQWLIEEIIPQMLAYGLKAQALVLPEDIFTKISVDKFRQKLPETYIIQFFDDFEKAKEWLHFIWSGISFFKSYLITSK